MANALDWAYTNGAHVANISYGRDGCKAGSVGSLIVDEAVDKGMVVVGAVGNDGKADQSVPAPRPDRAYGSIEGPHCSHNPIGVGGVLDRYDNGTQLATLQMYYDSSRGPTKSDIASLNGLLKPDIAAPAEGIAVLKNPRDYTVDTEKGTSFAAPQVAAAAALLLEAKPSMTPVEVKAALLLGAKWQGTGKCTASMYEEADSSSYCSHARKLTSAAASDRDTTLLNHVGLGVLNVKDSIKYATTAGHVMGDHLASASDRKSYTFTVTDATKPVKAVLAWLAHPKGSISFQAPTDTTTRHLTGSQDDLPELANLNLSVRQGTSTTQNHVSSSARQSVEFVYFVPTAGTYTVTVSAAKMGERPEQAFALASTHALTPSSTNTAPSTAARTVTIDPSGPTAVRLTGTDRQGDAVSFKATGAARGTVSASEQLTPTASRVVYVPGTSFGTGDSITVTPRLAPTARSSRSAWARPSTRWPCLGVASGRWSFPLLQRCRARSSRRRAPRRPGRCGRCRSATLPMRDPPYARRRARRALLRTRSSTHVTRERACPTGLARSPRRSRSRTVGSRRRYPPTWTSFTGTGAT